MGRPFCRGFLVDGDDVALLPPDRVFRELQAAIDAATAPADLAIARGETLGDDGGDFSDATGDDDGLAAVARSYLVHTMRWRANDLAVMDNAAIAHYAVPGTQRPAAEVGPRVLHRTTVVRDDLAGQYAAPAP